MDAVAIGRSTRRALVAAVLLLGLAGCSQTPPGVTAEPEPSRTPAATETAPPAEPSEEPDPEPDETAPPPEPSPDPATPVTLACSSLLSAQQLYDFNPNYGAAPDYAPEAAVIGRVVGLSGTACGWMNQTSGAVIETAVARPGASQLPDMQAVAAAGTAVPEWGDGWFEVDGDVGIAQVFVDGLWLVVASTEFVEPGDASPIVEAVLGNL